MRKIRMPQWIVGGPQVVGFFVNDEVVCFRHWDGRREARLYQPAFAEDLKNSPCKKCQKELEKEQEAIKPGATEERKEETMTKIELLELLTERAKAFRKDRDYFKRNTHMHAITDAPSQEVVDAVLTGFINQVGVTMGIDYA